MTLVAVLIVASLALAPASAAADGLPAAGIDAQPLSVPGGALTYTTERAGRDTRLIERARYGGPLRQRRCAASTRSRRSPTTAPPAGCPRTAAGSS